MPFFPRLGSWIAISDNVRNFRWNRCNKLNYRGLQQLRHNGSKRKPDSSRISSIKCDMDRCRIHPYLQRQPSSTATVPIYDTSGSGIPLEPNFLSLFSDSNFTGPQYDQYGSSVYSPSKLSTWCGPVPIQGDTPRRETAGPKLWVPWAPEWLMGRTVMTTTFGYGTAPIPLARSFPSTLFHPPSPSQSPNPERLRSWSQHCWDLQGHFICGGVGRRLDDR